MITLHDVGGVLGWPFFGLSQSHGHDSWLMCEVVLSVVTSRSYIP